MATVEATIRQLVEALWHPVEPQQIREHVGDFLVLAGGEHQFKIGFQTEKIANDVASGYNADRILYYAGVPYSSPTTGQTRSTSAFRAFAGSSST